MKPSRRIRYALEASFFLIIWAVFRALPLGAASWLGGALAGAIGPRLRAHRVALVNLRIAFPEKTDAEHKSIARGMWNHLGRVMAEFAHAPRGNLVDRIEVQGAENLPPNGQAYLFVSAHIGNWELSYPLAHVRGIPISLIYRHANNPWVERMICRIRAYHCAGMIRKDGRAGTKILSALRSKHAIAIMVDQKMNTGIVVPFFGQPAMTAPAVAQLALKYDIPLIPARVMRTRGAHFKGIIEPPITIQKNGDAAADALAIMTEINAMLERWIREAPEQWFWVHRRFDKTMYQ